MKLSSFSCAIIALTTTLGAATCVDAATIFVDFGGSADAAGNPNVFSSAAATTGGTIANLNDSTNTPTGYSAAISDVFLGQNGTAGMALIPGSPADLAGFSSFALGNFFNGVNFGGGTDQLGEITFSNLDPSLQYTFTIFASRQGTTENRETLYTVTGAGAGAATLNPSSNATNVAVVANIVPNGSNQIKLSVTDGPNNINGNKFSYINALRIDTSRTVPEPASVGLFGLGLLASALFRRRR